MWQLEGNYIDTLQSIFQGQSWVYSKDSQLIVCMKARIRMIGFSGPS